MDSFAEVPRSTKEEFLDSLDDHLNGDKLVSPDEIYSPSKKPNAEEKHSKPLQEVVWRWLEHDLRMATNERPIGAIATFKHFMSNGLNE